MTICFSRSIRLVLVLLLANLITGPLGAQIDTGAIVGTVRDASGAAVPDASVTLTNASTQEKSSTATNTSGEYQFSALRPGTYSVQVSAHGFGNQVRNDIEIHVQSRPSVDFNLVVGSINETVQVTAAEPLLQTQDAVLGGVVQTQQINDLPLNGRRYADLALLAPGIQKNLTNPNNTAPDRFSSNGNLETQNYFSLDGIDNNSGSTNLQEGSVQTVQPPPDALEEFRVQTRTYSSEFGTSAGAVINASLKSGTNGFHGDLWEFLRNSKLDSNSYFNNLGGVPRGRFSQNQFGGTIGGPIRKNKTFFFADAQGFLSRKATTVLSTVPTPLMQQGNFTELRNTLPAPSVPSQSGCVQANIIAQSCIDPVAAKLDALFPAPNVPSAVALLGQPRSWTGAPNYQFQYSVPNNTYSYDARIDHNLTQNNRLFGHFSNYHVNRQDPPWTGNPVAGNGNFATQYRIRGYNVALAWDDMLRPSAVNELRAGFNRDYAHSDPIGLTLGQSTASDYGLTGLPVSPNSAGIPPINISGLTRLGSSPWRPQYQVAQVWQLLDTLTWLKGNHSLKFGYEHRHNSDNFLDIQSPQGQITAAGIFTGNTGFGVPDFLLGDVSTAQFTTPTVVHNYEYAHNFFAQDQWRIRPNLTLTYGLRYELFTPVLNHQNAMANFTAANGGGFVLAADGGLFQRALVHPDRNDFAPRVGFAWQPMEKLVLRGGYGIFYQHMVRIGSESMLALNPPFVIDGSIAQSFPSTTPVFQLRNGFPSSQFTPALVDLTKLQVRAQDPNERTPYVSQVSFGPQIELSRSTVLDVSYVGNFGRKENRLRNANQGIFTGVDAKGNPVTLFPYANLNTSQTSLAGNHAFLELATNDGNTNYNGLLVSLNQRWSRGLGYGLSYTFSKNFSDYVDNLTGGSTPANAYDYALERGFSPFDVTHRFVGYATWDLPVGKGKALLDRGGAVNQILGGWQLNTIVTMETGTPFSVTAPDNSQTGANHASRANCIGDPYLNATTDPSQYVGGGAPGFFLNPAAFAVPTLGTFGNCAPRAFHGPGLQNVDFSAFKDFPVTERYRVQFRAEFFNGFNHANFNNPNASFSPSSLGSFGRSFSTVTDPREIQFGLKIYY